MNRYIVSSVLAVAAAAVTSTAFATTDYPFETAAFTSTKSRAEVQAELAQDQQRGVNVWAESYSPATTVRSNRSRAEVTADYVAHRNRFGSVIGEDSAAYLTQRAPSAIAPVLAGQPVNAQ